MDRDGGSGVAAVVVLHALAIQGTGFEPGLLVDGWKGMAAFVADAFPAGPELGQDHHGRGSKPPS